jgi:hypothetical protein
MRRISLAAFLSIVQADDDGNNSVAATTKPTLKSVAKPVEME